MKNLLQLIVFCNFLFFYSGILNAQTSPVNDGNSNDNEATLFELREDNKLAVVDSIRNFMEASGIIQIPSHGKLMAFLSTPFNSPVFNFDEEGCTIPGLDVYYDDIGGLSFQFNHADQDNAESLYVGFLPYADQYAEKSFVVYGEHIFNGNRVYLGPMQQHIILVGSLCIPCDNNTNDQCIGKMEILITDKNILR